MPTIQLPNEWSPREYQRPLWDYLESGGKRAIEIAHRRWGKDDVTLHRTAIAAHERVATYWHCLPEYEQARKAIWTAVNPHTGKRRIDEAFPEAIRASKDEQQMFIRFVNGSTWQVIGSDRYNSLVGAGVAGVVFSEWALCDPAAWAYIRPMIEENEGWAAFITTPRGRNHAKSFFDMASADPEWFAEVSSIVDTKALPLERLEKAKVELIALYGEDVGIAQFEQEYYCSFNAAILGAYFGREMAQAEVDGRICDVPVNPDYPVHTAWDLGKAANNPIWCFQVIGNKPRIVDFYRPENDDIDEWVDWLKEREYHGIDYVPHDANNTEWGTGRTRVEVLRSRGRSVRRLPLVSVEDGRTAARQTIKVAEFDRERCKVGLEGLRLYRREWDQEFRAFRQAPVKDWAEHIGSAFRYLGLAWRQTHELDEKPLSAPGEYIGQQNGSMKSTVTINDLIKKQIRKRKARESVRF